MQLRIWNAIAAATVIALLAPAARAQVSPQDLGKSLTPMGAEKAGNAAGTIPAWDGGLTQCPPEFKPGGHYPDPFPQDKPLFTIDASNLEKYKAHLSPGQIAMLKKYPDVEDECVSVAAHRCVPEGPL